MATENDLNQSINQAKKHYSSLFTLPSRTTAIAAAAVPCLLTGLSSAFFFRTLEGLATGIALGLVFFVVTFAADFSVSKLFLRDKIFDLRRTSVLSLFCWSVWFLFSLIGVGLGAVYGFGVWVKLCLLGLGIVLSFRTVVFLSVSLAPIASRLVAILLQPFACVAVLAAFWITHNVAAVSYLPYFAVCPFLAVGAAYLFIRQLDTIGKNAYHVPSIAIFKTFLLNWVTAENAPLEKHLETMGEDADVEVSILKFDANTPKAAFVMPLVHPGPFKNIGSSLLPSLMKQEYEAKFGCDTCIPLGLLGHELDAASQQQNYKIINQTLASAQFAASAQTATPYVTVSDGFVSASCQVFGKTAFLSFTLAPKTTEDLPQELGAIVRDEAAKLGLEALIVNAHNSITKNEEIEASIETLRNVAAKCLQKANSQPQSAFEVGSATVHPKQFTLKDGMGTGGITAIVVKVTDQKIAYVVIDGNNMISGLREKILAALSAAGFAQSEVFTTDTHAVSAVVLGPRGYHPVGEAMDQTALINEIVQAATQATAKLEPCKAGYQKLVVPKVRVIGGGALGFMTVLVDKTIQKAKHILLPIFGAETLVLLLLLLLL